MTALPVHAGSSDQNAITIKMNVSDINTASDYQDAVDRFRSKAKNACKVNGVKALSVKMQEGACVDKLVKSFEEQLNLRFKTVTFDRTDEAVG